MYAAVIHCGLCCNSDPWVSLTCGCQALLGKQGVVLAVPSSTAISRSRTASQGHVSLVGRFGTCKPGNLDLIDVSNMLFILLGCNDCVVCGQWHQDDMAERGPSSPPSGAPRREERVSSLQMHVDYTYTCGVNFLWGCMELVCLVLRQHGHVVHPPTHQFTFQSGLAAASGCATRSAAGPGPATCPPEAHPGMVTGFPRPPPASSAGLPEGGPIPGGSGFAGVPPVAPPAVLNPATHNTAGPTTPLVVPE